MNTVTVDRRASGSEFAQVDEKARIASIASEQTRPLRLVKRNSSWDNANGTRRTSGRSTCTAGSADRTPGNNNDSLSVMKRRRKLAKSTPGGSQTYGYTAYTVLHPPPRQTSWSCFRPTSEELVGSQTLNVRKHRQTRPALTCDALGDSSVSLLGRSYPGFHMSKNTEQAVESSMRSNVYTATAPPNNRDWSSSSRQEQYLGSTQGNTARTHPLNPSSAIYQASQTPHVLCPFVSVTPEVTALEDGQRSIWAAVEISGRLSKLSPRNTNIGGDNAPNTGSFADNQLDRFFEYGCLYDLTVEILPTEHTKIIQVVQEQPFPTTIYAGSSVLLLVEIKVRESDSSQSRRSHVRQKSDELIKDLEMQLGASRLSYMQIKMAYSHSAFPNYHSRPGVTGVTSLESKIETLAVASIKRHNALSLWSPRPSLAPNPLFSLIKRHWGEEKVSGAMQRILTQRAAQRSDGIGTKVPLKHAGLRLTAAKDIPLNIDLNRVADRPRNGSTFTIFRDADVPSSASSTDTQIYSGFPPDRRGSGRGPSNDLRGRRMNTEQAEDSQCRRKRSIGTDSMHALLPRLSDLASESIGGCRDRARRETATVATDYERSKRESGGWAWTKWF